jgi:post-segregation antitoxin (ccd killing protein)
MASITVRISDELKKELQDSGINISEVTRKALKAEVKKIQEQRAREAAQELSKLLSEVPDEEIIKAIRETRDQR